MLKRDNKVKWTAKYKASFEHVKKSIGEAPVLVSPNYTKKLFIFSFASQHTVEEMILQMNEEGFKQPIVLFQQKPQGCRAKI
jgi:hypothetical protein